MLLRTLLFILISGICYAENPPTTLYDEGAKQGVIFNINCVGDGISCTKSSITGTLSVSGGGGVGVGTVNPGTAGRFTYYPSTGTTVDDQTVLTTDGTNVGIGSASPTTKLDIKTSSAQFGWSHSDGTVRLNSYLQSTGVVGGWLGTQSNHDLHFFTNNSNPHMTISAAGNVGIGTTLPTGELVISSTASNDLLRVEDNGAGDTTPVVITSAGKVGVGTTNPLADFHVVGTTSGGTGIINSWFTAGDADQWVAFRAGETTDYRSYLAWFNYTGSSHQWLLGRNASNDFIMYDNTSGHRFVFNDGAESYISSAGTSAIILNGHPDNGSGTGGMYVSSGGSDKTLQFRVTPTISAANYVNVTGGLAGSGATIATAGSDTNVNLLLAPKGSGNVGINSTVPTTKLDVAGTTKSSAFIASNITGSTQCVQADSSGNLTGTGSACGGSGSPGGANRQVQFNDSGSFGGDSGFTYVGANVGISTSTPVALLDITSTANQDLFIVNDNGASDITPFVVSASGNVGIGSSNPNYKLVTSGTSYTTSTATSGSVLVGTTSATYATTGIINGEQNSSNDVFSGETPSLVLSNLSTSTRSFARMKLVANAGSTEGYFIVNGLGSSLTAFPSVGAAIGTHSNHPFGFFTNGTEIARFNSSGNLGIGTTVPPNKLYVAGTAEVQGFKLPSSPSAGHVLTSSSVGVGTWQAPRLANVDEQLFTADGTWTKPAGAYLVELFMCGGGGGGASGRYGTTGAASGGSSGAGAGAFYGMFPAGYFGSTEAVVVGQGGTGGAAQSTPDTDGNDGVLGGDTTFDIFTAKGGTYGFAGSTGAPGSGQGGVGNSPFVVLTGQTGSNSSITTGGASAATTQAVLIPKGGGGGGAINAGGSVLNPGAGGGLNANVFTSSLVGTAGTSGVSPTAGGNGGAGYAVTGYYVGGGGGGGGSTVTAATAAAAGGNAGDYCGGGGGGGASRSGASGAGGDGADGVVFVRTYIQG